MLLRTHCTSAIRVLTGAALVAGAAEAQLPFDLIDISAPSHPAYPGIAATYGSNFGLFTESGGISIADYDNDGLLDVFIPINKNFANKLYRNLGGGHFADVAATCGVTDPAMATSVAMLVDYDNDGDRDLFTFGHAGWSTTTFLPLVKVFRNRGAASGSTFANVTSQCGFVLDSNTVKGTTKGLCGGATVGDYNRDGYLDVFVAYWQGTNNTDLWRLWKSVPNPVPGLPSDPTWSPRIFVDDTVAAGLNVDITPGEAWQPSFVDLNRDGWLDLHVAVDFGLDQMFVNDGTGKFLPDVASAVGLNGSPPDLRNEMGVAFGDYDHDGDLDLHSTNIGDIDRCYRNDSVSPLLQFTDVAPINLTGNSAWGWGTIFFDVDNDGDLDHSSVSGFKFPTSLPYWGRLHINQFPLTISHGPNILFQDVSTQVPEYSGTNLPEGLSCRGLVAFDLDSDGDLDALQARRVGGYAIFQNTLVSTDQWLEVDVVERDDSLNVEGTRMWVRAAGTTQMREIISGSSFQCQEPARQHFGLGKHAGTTFQWLVVRWFDGRYQLVSDVDFDAVNTIHASERDDVGDMDGDRHLTTLDYTLLDMAVYNWTQYEQFFADLPGRVTGDIDGNGRLTRKDLRLWKLLPAH